MVRLNRYNRRKLWEILYDEIGLGYNDQNGSVLALIHKSEVNDYLSGKDVSGQIVSYFVLNDEEFPNYYIVGKLDNGWHDSDCPPDYSILDEDETKVLNSMKVFPWFNCGKPDEWEMALVEKVARKMHKKIDFRERVIDYLLARENREKETNKFTSQDSHEHLKEAIKGCGLL